MSLKSYNEVSTELNSSNESKINESLLNKINQIFKIVLEENEKLKNYPDKLSSRRGVAFNSNYIPSISIKKYLYRIAYYTEIEENTIIMALIYIDRISEISKIMLTPYNIHRIIFSAILLAIKYNEDIIFNFDYYSKVAGISIKELQILENDFSVLLRFKFFVSQELFDNYKSYIEDIDDINDDDEENNKIKKIL